MKLAYVTACDPLNVRPWSGLPYYIRQSLHNQMVPMEHIGPLVDQSAIKAVCKLKRYYHALGRKKYLKDPEPLRLKSYANQIQTKLNQTQVDIVLSVTHRPVTYLECRQPIVFWADASFAGLLNFYPQYYNLCSTTIHDGHYMENLILQKCSLGIYASEWAAKTAIENYNVDPSKIKVVPFGANLDNKLTVDEIKVLVDSRPQNKCKLLFLGVDWFRKGGDIAFKVAKALNLSGLETELTIVGCQPILDEPLPNYLKPLGFVSKSTIEGQEKLSKLLAESHFLILPSQAECFGIVFSEASSFGVPSIATNVGGIPSAIRDNINGQLFNPDAEIEQYCSYISNLFTNYSDYKKLAVSAFHEYQSRLNWDTSGKVVKQLLEEL
ncbi:MAG: glycosyltransferase [Cyanobacteria bacterium RM1_2_2]|nr:glycosyltransferase [Cyanobacteria bacterium RM1_2_2]